LGYVSIVNALQRVLDKSAIYNETHSKIVGWTRKDKKLVVPALLREAIVNAFVHNDYSRQDTPIFEVFSNKFTITSYGGLVDELSTDDFFAGVSCPRNPILMKIFKDLEYVEHIGSGIPRIIKHYGKDAFYISKAIIRITLPFECGELPYTPGDDAQVNARTDTNRDTATDKVADQVTDQVKRLLVAIANTKLDAKTCMQSIGLRHLPTFRSSYLSPAVKAGLVEMTIPDKPNSRLQKYRLTAKGRALFAKISLAQPRGKQQPPNNAQNTTNG
jgi:predicted HTH transcriptional regulator